MARIAIAGLGTVGCGLVSLLEDRREQIEIVSLSARDRGKSRSVATSNYEWYDDAVVMARESKVDIFVELIGGADGIAYDCARAAIESGKAYVTANKALLASHGSELAALAEKHECAVGWEASVGGAMPIIAAIRQSLLANKAESLIGILNGTCNYILTRLEQGDTFAQALATAQAHGYAEADSHSDIAGDDSAQKISLLGALAFSTPPSLANVSVEGIASITSEDVHTAERCGYSIRLLAIAELLSDRLSLRVHPTLLRKDSVLARVSGVSNALVYRGDFCGQVFLSGLGAGGAATASAVAGDILAIARGRNIPMFGLPNASLHALPNCPLQDIVSPWHLHLRVKDQVGIVASVSAILRDCNISLSSILQEGVTMGEEKDKKDASEYVSLLLFTHRASTAAIDRALSRVSELGILESLPFSIRILQE